MLRTALSIAFALILCCWFVGESRSEPAEKDPAVERARREVRMLDDIYKTSIVLITTHYVDDEDSMPAGEAFKALFEAVEQKGWHKVRLVDATGDPYNDDNVAQTPFEKEGIRQLLKGKASFDQVVRRDGKRFLNAVTAVPVVMDKCVLCHDNYANVAKGQAIGAVSYEVPILE